MWVSLYRCPRQAGQFCRPRVPLRGKIGARRVFSGASSLVTGEANKPKGGSYGRFQGCLPKPRKLRSRPYPAAADTTILASTYWANHWKRWGAKPEAGVQRKSFVKCCFLHDARSAALGRTIGNGGKQCQRLWGLPPYARSAAGYLCVRLSKERIMYLWTLKKSFP